MNKDTNPALFAEIERMKARSIREMAMYEFDADVSTLESLGMDHDTAEHVVTAISRMVLGVV